MPRQWTGYRGMGSRQRTQITTLWMTLVSLPKASQHRTSARRMLEPPPEDLTTAESDDHSRKSRIEGPDLGDLDQGDAPRHREDSLWRPRLLSEPPGQGHSGM